jgi:hypothetical protein
MADSPKKPVSSEPSITSFAEGHGWHLTPEETQRRMMDHVERIMRAKQEQIEREQRAAEEFERGLQEKLENMEANSPADTAEPAPIAQPPLEPQPLIDPFRSGAPGRPSAIEIVIAEGRRRIEAGEEIPTLRGLTQFATKLREWWDQERMKFDPSGPSVSAKTICNNLRSFWSSKL